MYINTQYLTHTPLSSPLSSSSSSFSFSITSPPPLQDACGVLSVVAEVLGDLVKGDPAPPPPTPPPHTRKAVRFCMCSDDGDGDDGGDDGDAWVC